MCINDWRLGRMIRAVTRPVVSIATGPLTLARNPQRVGITYTMLISDGIFDEGANIINTADNNVMAYLSGGGGYLHWTLATHGELPMLGQSVVVLTAPTSRVSVVEYLLPEEFLQAAFSEFQRDYPGIS